MPEEYWQTKDRDLIGGPDFSVKKIGGKWQIVHRIEHDNPADYYNTVKKIGKKRAYNDAVLTATAASDIFMPDDSTEPEIMQSNEDAAEFQQPQRMSNQVQRNDENLATEKQRKMIFVRLKNADIDLPIFENEFGKLDDLPFKKVNIALEWIGGFNQ